MANIGLPWSVPTTGYTIQPVNGEFAAWSQGINVPPDGWTVQSGQWVTDMSQCQGTLGPYAVDFGAVSGVGALTSDDIVVLPATKYLFSAYYRIVTGSGASKSQGARIDWYDDSRALLESTNLDCISNTAGAWTAAGLEVTSPNSAVYARVIVGRFNIQGSTDFQLDSVKFDRKVYIPSGTVSMDEVADGPTTYARPKLEFMENGVIKAVLRGAGTVATDFLFKKPNTTDPDSLDGIPNGTTYGRPKLDALTVAGYPDMDKVVDGTTYARVKGTMLTGGEITSLSRGGSVYATSTFFQKALDSLDNVLDGATYGRPKLDGLNASGYPLLDKVVDGTLFRKVGVNYVNASGQITAIRNTSGSGADIPGTAVFSKAVDNLGAITDGGGFRKIADAYADTSGRITSVFRNSSPVSVDTLFKKASAADADTLDGIPNGTTYARVNATALSSGNPKTDSLVDGTYAKVLADHLTSGAITSITRGGTRYASTSFFNTGLDNLGNIANGGGFNKTSSTYVNTSGQITSVRRAGADESVDNLFKKSSDTFASVAGTLSDGQLGGNVVNTSNIKDNAVTPAKLDDGVHMAVWDEGKGHQLANRVTFVANGSTATPEADQGYTSFNVTSGTTDFYVETNVQFRATKDLAVSITYRTSGTGWAATSTLRIFNIANTAQRADVTMVADGNWHTATFDISGWTGTGTIRFDPQDGGAAIGSAAFQVASVCAGTLGVSSAGGYRLANTQGGLTGNLSLTGALTVSSGLTTLNKPTSGNQALSILGTDTVTQAITTTSNTAASFPQLQVLNYGANGGYPVLAHYNSRGTLASPAALSASDTLGGLVFYGRGTTNFFAGAQIKAIATTAPTTAITSALAFETCNNSFLGTTERVRIHPSGSVGIGTTATESLAELAVKGLSSGNADLLLVEGDTSNGWNFAALTGDDSFRLARFVSPGTYSDHLTILTTGNTGLGTTSPQERLHVAGNIRNSALAGVGNRLVYSDANGNLTNTSSDATLKEDVQELDNALPVVLAMRPVSFSWKDKERFGPYTEIGFMAQEMLELVPFVVGTNHDGTYAIDYPKLTAVLARAIQELTVRLERLESNLG